MAKWIVMGAAAVDTVVKVPCFPQIDEIVYPDSLARCPGGSTANVAVGLARLGEQTAFLGKIGEDDGGRTIRESFLEEGVDVSGLLTVPGENSGGAFIAVNAAGERVIYSLGGKALYEDPAELNRDTFDGADGLYIGECFESVGRSAMEAAEAAGARICFGPGGICCGYGLSYYGELVKKADYLFLSLPELSSLTGEAEREEAIRILLETGLGNLVLTEGSRGASIYRSSGEILHYPAFRAEKVVDTTGAGDAFTAGFLHALTLDRSGEECLKYGAACGAIAIGAPGARTALAISGEPEKLLGQMAEKE